MGRITSIPGINVIEPDKCATLETQFWEFTNRSDMLGIDNFSTFISHPKLPTLESQLTFIQEFLYNVSNKRLGDTRNRSLDGLITYAYDFGYPRFTWDHLPSVDEVLSINMDDCDGIAVVTCSLLEGILVRLLLNQIPIRGR